MNRINQFALAVVVLISLSTSLWGQTYTFETVTDPADPTFTQLLGINNAGTIAGYYGSGGTAHPNKGFVLELPSTFTTENFPGSAQTQVTGIDSKGDTCGFYIDSTGVNHGFRRNGTKFGKIDHPGTIFNHSLGRNDLEQVVGFYNDTAGISHAYFSDTDGGVYADLILPKSVSAVATGINNSQWVSGFYTNTSGVTRGFLLQGGTFKIVDFPASTLTMVLGLNNKDQVVGSYIDASGVTHGFVLNLSTQTYTTIDDPNGIGSTVANGINDSGKIVGFYVNATGNTAGFVATP